MLYRVHMTNYNQKLIESDNNKDLIKYLKNNNISYNSYELVQQTSIGDKIKANMQLQEFVERALSHIFDADMDGYHDFRAEICEEIGVTQEQFYEMFNELGYDKYDGYECERGQECPYNASNIHECKKHCGYDGIDVQEE